MTTPARCLHFALPYDSRFLWIYGGLTSGRAIWLEGMIFALWYSLHTHSLLSHRLKNVSFTYYINTVLEMLTNAPSLQ